MLDLMSSVTNIPISQLEQHFEGKMYGHLKGEVADAVVAFLEPVQKKYADLRSNEDYLLQVFRKGAEKARIRASQTLKEVQKTIGFIVKD